MKVLVTGGCGYIGSHTIVELLQDNHEVVCLDDLSNSTDEVLTNIAKVTGKQVLNHRISVNDKDALSIFFKSYGPFDGVIHFAALKSVNESVVEPLKYYQNNVSGLINLIDAMVASGSKNLIFSSSCSVYGDVETLPVDEVTPLGETASPYARTKKIGEEILSDIARFGRQVKCIALRYFNPAGAHPSNELGESPTINASNLVPVITETAIGRRPEMVVFGDDYDTRDGTCVRDFIHVSDIASAHVLALKLETSPTYQLDFNVINLGTGRGSTVLEAINAFESTTGVSLNYRIGSRREGDVIAIYADNRKAQQLLQWYPKYDIEDIMRTAWEWEQKRSQNLG